MKVTITLSFACALLAGCQQESNDESVKVAVDVMEEAAIEESPEAIASKLKYQKAYDQVVVGETTLKHFSINIMKTSYSPTLGEANAWGETDEHGNGLYLKLSDEVVTAKSLKKEDIFPE